jgi:ribonuclease III
VRRTVKLTATLAQISEPRQLENTIDYSFSNVSLLEQALTHRSASSKHNERLEFLGDAILGMCAAQLLFDAYPSWREGQLTRARATLVKRESLAEIAREIGLGKYLIVGAGELKSGGRQRDSTLADALEAVLGAVLIDGGFTAAQRLIQQFMGSRIAAMDANPGKDYKTRLQEFLQARAHDLPTYTVKETTGLSHAQTFIVECELKALSVQVIGTGTSRRLAEQHAAQLALEGLESNG